MNKDIKNFLDEMGGGRILPPAKPCCCSSNEVDPLVSPNLLFFNSLQVGETSEYQAILIRNTTNKTIHISNVSIAGPYEFDPIAVIPESLIPGASYRFTIRFAPHQVGEMNGAVYVDIVGFGIIAVGLVGNATPSIYTVDELPAGELGLRAFVTDALTPIWGDPVVGGGAVKVPVFHNGTIWRVG